MQRITCTLLCLLLFSSLQAQIKGNKKSLTQSFEAEKVTSIYIGLYAHVEIDCSGPSGIEITAEENLFEHIDRSIENGHLRLDQLKWIQPTQRVHIKIGAPDLSSVTLSTHDIVHIHNIDRTSFKAEAEVGTIVLKGQLQILQAISTGGTINANELQTPFVTIEMNGNGSIELGSPDVITGSIKDGGTLVYDNQSTDLQVVADNESTISTLQQMTEKAPESTRYIEFKIKNNSWNRLNAYVIGPKPDGKKFSYGFPMRPGQVRAEKWTIGTKVYRTSSLGIKKLLIEITAANEGQIVNLH